MIKRLILFSFLIGMSVGAMAQASWEHFGQNRVQYRTFEWKYFDSTHFRTFYYDYGKANAMYTVNLAEQELSRIVYLMGGRLNKKLNIILYNSFGDYRQTNLGRKNDELNAANGGKVDVAGDYIAIYFNGDHNQLRKQIRSGIAKVIKDNMLFGDNIKDVVKNAVQMNLPDWYTLGYVSFIASEWTGENEANLQNIQEELKNQTYYLDKKRVKEIPKEGNKVRKLSIPTIKDRVVEGALKFILEPIFEADFQPGSCGYRPKRTAAEAIGRVAKAVLCRL